MLLIALVSVPGLARGRPGSSPTSKPWLRAPLPTCWVTGVTITSLPPGIPPRFTGDVWKTLRDHCLEGTVEIQNRIWYRIGQDALAAKPPSPAVPPASRFRCWSTARLVKPGGFLTAENPISLCAGREVFLFFFFLF